MTISSLREFQSSKLFIEFVNFNKFCGTSDSTPSFKLDFFSISLHCCYVQLSHRISAYSIKNEYKQSRYFHEISDWLLILLFLEDLFKTKLSP